MNVQEGDEFIITPTSVKKSLPPLLKPVFVVAGDGTKYIAARFEAAKSTYKWGLLFKGKIIGTIDDVVYWSGLYKEKKKEGKAV